MSETVKHTPLNINVFAGFMHDVFSWMTATANEKKVPESGRQGGIIFGTHEKRVPIDSRGVAADCQNSICTLRRFFPD